MSLTNFLRKLSTPSSRRRGRNASPAVFSAAETVEPRLLLSADALVDVDPDHSGPREYTNDFGHTVLQSPGLDPLHSAAFFDGGGSSGGDAGGTNPLDSIPELHSLAGAPVTIYLDFDGHVEPGGTGWSNNDIVTPVFDIDGDLTTFSDEELRRIEEVWYRVAEDFAPFNVNVTTVDPGSFNNFEAILLSIGGDGAWLGAQAGGVAFLNAFNNGASNTAYVFSDNLGPGNAYFISTAASHEAGHTFGLNHHSVYDANGNKTSEYDPGTAEVGPIMGAVYGSARDLWYNAPGNQAADIFQDDLAEMTRPANQTFAYRVDDHGNTTADATQLPGDQADVAIPGVLETNDDIDMFRFSTDSGDITFSANGVDVNDIFNINTNNRGSNADLILRLFDENGNLIQEDNDTGSSDATMTVTVAAGTYYIGVTSTDEYGAIGQYDLTGTIIPLPTLPVMLAPTGTLDQPTPVFEWTRVATVDYYELDVDNLSTGASSFYVREVSGAVTHTADRQFAEGDYQARVRAVLTDGRIGDWSEYISFDVDIPAPSRPELTAPNTGKNTDSTPLFTWTEPASAVRYTLWVQEIDAATGNWKNRVIHRTNYESAAYEHFDALADGSYRAWVQAFNSVGESSLWSEPLSFSIEAPTPDAPILTAPNIVMEHRYPRIVWDAVENAHRYDLWVDHLNSRTNQIIRTNTIEGTQNFYDPVTALPQGTFIAWVRGINGNGTPGDWSDAFRFEVDIPTPATTQLTGPRNSAGGSEVGDGAVTFTWDSAEDAVSYDLWVNNRTTGEIQVVREVGVTGNSFSVASPLAQGSYTAWIRGINSANEVGLWSTPFSFSVDIPTPTQPTITGPVPGTAGAVETSLPTITWDIVLEGATYDLWIDNNTLSETQVIRVRDISGANGNREYTIPESLQLDEHSYTLWLRAANTDGEYSDWSDPYRIRIDIPNAVTPQIVSPVGADDDTTPTFVWTHHNSSASYEILIRDLERKENIVIQLSTDQFSVSSDGLTANYTLGAAEALQVGTYRFWMRAFNELGQSSDWSASQSFAITAMLDLQDSSEGALAEGVVLTHFDLTDTELPADIIEVPEAKPGTPVHVDTGAPADVNEEAVAPETDVQEDNVLVAVMEEFADPAGADHLVLLTEESNS